MILCPECGSDDRRVIASRSQRKEAAKRRRCVCNACGFRFTTQERIWTGEPGPPAPGQVPVDPIWLKRLDRIDALMAKLSEVLDEGTAATVTDPPLHGSCTVPARSVSIDQLGLRTIRAYNSLKRAGIITVDQLVTLTAADLLQLRQFGTTSLADVGEALAEMGLTLSTPTSPKNPNPLGSVAPSPLP
jgi:hypothetical protein